MENKTNLRQTLENQKILLEKIEDSKYKFIHTDKSGVKTTIDTGSVFVNRLFFSPAIEIGEMIQFYMGIMVDFHEPGRTSIRCPHYFSIMFSLPDSITQKAILANESTEIIQSNKININPMIFLMDPKSRAENKNAICYLFYGRNFKWEDSLWMPYNLNLPDEVIENFISVYLGEKGILYSSRNSIAKMLYLSAVTITTLGYGDIVPTTDWARILVMLEAIFRVITIGWKW